MNRVSNRYRQKAKSSIKSAERLAYLPVPHERSVTPRRAHVVGPSAFLVFPALLRPNLPDSCSMPNCISQVLASKDSTATKDPAIEENDKNRGDANSNGRR